jgi:hypothetical protein
VFYVGGYDPGAAAGFYRRFLRQQEIFKRTWSVESVCSEVSVSGHSLRWSVTTTAPSWSVQTDFELLSWDDLIAKAAASSPLVRFGRSAAVYANLVASGTLLRYFRANPRYFAFAVAPLFQFAALVVLSVAVGLVGAMLPEPLSVVGAPSAALVSFIVLQKWLGRRWRLHQALDDWVVSLDYIYRRREDLKERISEFARVISSAVNQISADEILVVGHSLGATLAADALSQSLDGVVGQISFATLGATIPKCTLHPDAAWLRERVAAVARTPTVYWVEVQTRADPISFFRVHPVSLERVADGDQLRGVNPVIRRAKLREMLEPSTYQKIRWRPLRLHYQCVSANERKAAYDFFMMICGPAAVPLWSKTEKGLKNIDAGLDLVR